MNEEEFKKLMEQSSKLPCRAEITAKDGESASMEVWSAYTIKDGVRSQIIDDSITLSTNLIDGDKLPSSVLLSVPTQDNEESKITIKGNAMVKNKENFYKLNKFKEIVRSSTSGKKVKVKSKDTPEAHIDVIFQFGEKHPHISFSPDGNGRFVRQSGFGCGLESILDYDPAAKTISPSKIAIHVEDISETLIMEFNFDSKAKTVDLVKAEFVLN